MWSRSHLARTQSEKRPLLKIWFREPDKTVRVIDNLAAIALPLRRMARLNTVQ